MDFEIEFVETDELEDSGAVHENQPPLSDKLTFNPGESNPGESNIAIEVLLDILRQMFGRKSVSFEPKDY